MTTLNTAAVPLQHPDRLFIDGKWVAPSSTATIDVIDSGTEELYFQVAEAQAADMDHAVSAARAAFDEGPWPRLTHEERAGYLRAMAGQLRARIPDIAEVWPRQAGVLQGLAFNMSEGDAHTLEYYAGLAATYPFEERYESAANGAFGLRVSEPVGVVGAIIPWNSPLALLVVKVAPALLAGCTVVVKASPEAPGEAYVFAEIAEAVGLPPGVINVVTADRDVSELLVRDPRVDKIAFTGSTAAGRRIASILGERIGRYTLELGGKSAAVVLDDADIAQTAAVLAGQQCLASGQVCASLTRVIVSGDRYDELVDALAANFAGVRVGSPFDPETQMGPLAMSRQRDRVEGFIDRGVAAGARLITGGKRPAHLTRGYYIEPTLFADVDNSSELAQQEIFGPVLSVIRAADDREAVRFANDTIYGLAGAVFTADTNRARTVAGQIRAGTISHNSFNFDVQIGVGGFKQSGVGREGGLAGLLPYLETKAVLLADAPDA
ncbi:aldehyde dehydrogenase [Nocardioides sp. GXZ039]|uniref:aldehyde dehydrogenase n=1 Tax=Nocardioides sp. GXZ039 TaxID=3136018 RepID=UPI0030F46540